MSDDEGRGALYRTPVRPTHLSINAMIDSAISSANDNASSDSELPLEHRPIGIIRRMDLMDKQGDDRRTRRDTSAQCSSAMDGVSIASLEWDEDSRMGSTDGMPKQSKLNSAFLSAKVDRVDVNGSRDLMAHAMDVCAQNGQAIKMLHTLYTRHNYRKCVSVAGPVSVAVSEDHGVTNVLAAVLCARQRRALGRIVQCANWVTIEEVRRTLENQLIHFQSVHHIAAHYPFMNDYPFTNDERDWCRRQQTDDKPMTPIDMVLMCLRHLWTWVN
jgi:hypothetical protein